MREWNPKLESFQSDFFFSESRFPAMVAAWATGKTMVGILKAMDLSIRYPGNLGLVVRKNFTDLKDSTMKDFTRYTGIRVPSNKDVELSNGSTIMFRHMDELSGIVQNVNLGWFFIEQAEEFDTDDEFQLLRGRLRRDNCKHQGFIIANTNGHNWVWRLWKKGNADGFSLTEAKTEDNSANLPKDFIADLARMKEQSPAHYNRYVLNSWEDVDADDRCIPYSAIMESIDRDVFCLTEHRRLICCDPAEFGEDKTVMMALDEGRITDIETYRKKNPVEVGGLMASMARKHNTNDVAVDSIGIGSGVRAWLGEMGFDVVGVNVGEKSSDPEKWKNLKAEVWMAAQSLFREGKVSIPQQDDLIEDLSAVRYLVNAKGQVQIESKKKTRQRLGRSPDFGDCLVLGLYAMNSIESRPVVDIEDDMCVSNSYSIKSVI